MDKGADDKSKLEKLKNRMEINNTVILSIATLAITWCSYQSILWDGIQTFKLVESNKDNRLAQDKSMMIIQHQAMDKNVVISFVNSVMERNTQKAKSSLHYMRPELANILKAWLDLDPAVNAEAPPHPMEMKEYQLLFEKDAAESRELLKQSDIKWKEAQQANTNSDRYSLFTVIFSMVMFLGAIATKMSLVRLSFTLVVVSGFICITTLIILFLLMPLATE